MMKKYLYILVFLPLFWYGCGDYLDTVPKNDIETIETIFEKREQVDRWLKTCHTFLCTPVVYKVDNVAYAGADEVVASDYIHKWMTDNKYRGEWGGFYIANGLQMAQEPYGNVWQNDKFYAGIHYCNVFLKNIGKTYNMEEAEKMLWSAEIKALKAHFYFELMRRYGPIILVPENLDVNSEAEILQQPRAPIDSVVQAIVDLCDEAMEVLPPMNQKSLARITYHNLESAAMLKAYALFYAASPLFNGNPAYASFTNKNGVKLFPENVDKAKWKRAAEAIDDVVRLCKQGGKQLVSGNATQSTPLLRKMRDIELSTRIVDHNSDEALLFFNTPAATFATWSKWALPYVASTESYFYSDQIVGCVAATMKMVEMFYTNHGLPIEYDTQWDYTARYQLGKETDPEYRDVVPLNTKTVLNLHLRREPRFYANIAADRTYWQRGRYAYDYLVYAYRGERYGTKASMISSSLPQNLTGYWVKKDSYSEASGQEAPSYLNRNDGAAVFRLAEVYLMQAEAWNEYLDAPDYEHVYAPLNEVRKRAGVLDVETAWQSYSKAPDKVKTQAGMREIIHREWDIEFAFEGRRFWNLRRWLQAEVLNEKVYGWNILGKTAEQFYNHFDGPIVVWSKRGFVSPRDYLFPIRSEEVLISGCKQNPGW